MLLLLLSDPHDAEEEGEPALCGCTNDAGAEVKDAERRLRQPGLDLGLRAAVGAKTSQVTSKRTELRAAGDSVGTQCPGCLRCEGKEPDPETTFLAPPE